MAQKIGQFLVETAHKCTILQQTGEQTTSGPSSPGLDQGPAQGLTQASPGQPRPAQVSPGQPRPKSLSKNGFLANREPKGGARARSARAPFWVAAEGRHLYLPKNNFLTSFLAWADLGWPGLAWVKPQAGPGQALGWAREALGTMGFFGWFFLDRPLIQKNPYPKTPFVPSLKPFCQKTFF